MTGAQAGAPPSPVPDRGATRADLLIAGALALSTILVVGLTQGPVGVPRDESYYFRAAQDYAGWYSDVWEALKRGKPGEAFTDAAIVRRFDYNHEHPVLPKTLFGLSHALFTDRLQWLGDEAGFRLPGWCFAGLLSALLYLMAARLVSRRGALFAVAALWSAPRHFFHAHLACFDVPMAAAWMAVVYCYWRGLSSRRWALLTGLAYGMALSVKHNAWILPGVLAVHFLLAEAPVRWKEGRWRGLGRGLLPFASLCLLGPLLFFAHWPYLWHSPWDRFRWYASFHTTHLNYPWEYLGRLLVERPYPLGYAFVVTALTVPLSTAVAMATGALRELARFVGTYLWTGARRWSGGLDSDGLLLLGNAFASLTVFSLGFVPIFGGMKHWLPALPFLCILAARALERTSAATVELVPRLRPVAFLSLAALVIAPGVVGTVHNHPYGTSYYNELAGGYPGAATLGMHRQYWSNNVTGVLPWLNQNAPRNARVFFHEVTFDSYSAYRKSGALRPDIQYAGGPQDSDLAAYQYMPEFRDVEMQIWNLYGTQVPVAGLYLDETPQVVIYRRR